MVTKLPGSTQHLKDLFHGEVKTMYLQTHDNLDRNTYLEICEWKGGLTCNAIQSLIGLEISDAETTLGSCIQLVDDMLDVNDDISLNINTIVTYDYKTDNNLDKILLYTVNRIDNMNRRYNFFKPILYLGLVLAVHTNQDKYSQEMLHIIKPFIHYNPSTTKEGLMKWFLHKLEPHLSY